MSDPGYFVHPTAVVHESALIGGGTQIWHFSHVMQGARIGERCIFGQNCHIANDVSIGNNVKVQNNVSVYAGTVIEDDVFVGPSCVLTNVINPRSQIHRYAPVGPTAIRLGATLGANATIVCGVELGQYCLVAAGAVVVRNVPAYALVQGNPARQSGWMSRHGHRLTRHGSSSVMVCVESGWRYQEVAPGVVRCLDFDEAAPVSADSISEIPGTTT